MSKGKSPAFQFYASDFLTGTAEYEAISVGAYIRLLSTQWVNGTLPDDTIKLARIAGVSTEEMIVIWKEIESKFEQKNGRLVNKKLEKIRKEKNKFIKEASEYGKKGASKRWGKDRKPDRVPHADPSGENVTLLSSSSTSSSISSSPPTSQETDPPPPPKKETPKEFGKPEINELMSFLKTKLDCKSLDGGEEKNRHAAQRLLTKVKKEFPELKPVEQIKLLINAAQKIDWLAAQMVSYTWIDYNFQKIIKNIKTTHNGSGKKATDDELAQAVRDLHLDNRE